MGGIRNEAGSMDIGDDWAIIGYHANQSAGSGSPAQGKKRSADGRNDWNDSL
jgi:hypothetical protein